MKSFFFFLFLSAALSTTTHAAELSGYLIDQQCIALCTGASPTAPCAPDGINVFYTPELHTGWCKLLEKCVASGYVLLGEEKDATTGMHPIILEMAGEESQATTVAYITSQTAGPFPKVTVRYDETIAETSDSGIPMAYNVTIQDPWATDASYYSGTPTHQVLCDDSSQPNVEANNLCFRSNVVVTLGPENMFVIESNGCPDHANMQGSTGTVANPQGDFGSSGTKNETGSKCDACASCGAGCGACGSCGTECGASCSSGCGSCSAGCDSCGSCGAGCDAGCGSCSAGCDAGCDSCSAGCDSCGSYSAGCDSCSANCSAACGSCSAGCDAASANRILQDAGCSASCGANSTGCCASTSGGCCASGGANSTGCCSSTIGGCCASCGANSTGCCAADCGSGGGCCASGCDGGGSCSDCHTESHGMYDPMYQHYTMMIPQTPGTPGEPTYFEDDDVVGIMSNGVLLDSHQPTWSYDSCNGHSDKKHQYHYHLPPMCLLQSVGVDFAETADWWKDGDQVRDYADMANQFPSTGSASPVIGFARDGFPIFGIYDDQGVLMRSADLDECNGKTDSLGNYGYYMTVDPPFAPQCLRGQVGSFSYYSTSKACPKEGIVNTVLDGTAIAACEMIPFADLANCEPVGEESIEKSSTTHLVTSASIALGLFAVVL